MIVVLVIIVFITAVAVTGQSAFNRSLVLTDTAYTVAFSIREAQNLGLSSRAVGGVYDAGYGIQFSTQTPTAYVLFADTSPASPGIDPADNPYCRGHEARVSTDPEAHPGDCIYNGSAELVRTYTLNRGFTISQFCGTRVSDNTQACSGTHFQTMHISFMRPSTNTRIFGRTIDGVQTALSDATIRLRAPDGGAFRCITVSQVGQIAVGACP